MSDPSTTASIILPTWDLIITLMLIVGVGYGIVLQRERILSTLVGAYVGIAVAQNWGPEFFEFFNGNNTLFNQLWIKANFSMFTIKAFLFGLVIILLTVKSDFSQSIKESTAPLSGLMVIIYSFLSTLLSISAVLSFLPDKQLAIIVKRSHLAEFIMNYQLSWIVLPVAAMVIGAWIVGKNTTSSED